MIVEDDYDFPIDPGADLAQAALNVIWRAAGYMNLYPDSQLTYALKVLQYKAQKYLDDQESRHTLTDIDLFLIEAQ